MDFLNLLRQKIMGAGPNPQDSIFGLRQEYQRHAIEQQSMGQPVMTFDEFVRQRQRAPQQPGPQSDMDALRQMPQGPLSERDRMMMLIRRGQ